MGITLNDIVGMDVLRSANILTSRHDLDTEVSGISIMEAPDIAQWVSGHEIILTSLYAVLFDKRLMEEFIKSLYQKKICALFIKTKRYVENVPAEILRTAEELGITVLEIPPDIPYKDIMFPVMAAIFDNQVIELSYYKKTRNLLTGYALRNVGIEGITRAFSDLVGHPAVVFDREWEVICATARDAPDAGAFEMESEQTIEGIRCRVYRDVAQQGSRTTYLVMPIVVLETEVGYLAVETDRRGFTELEMIAMQNALAVISQEMLKSHTVNEAKRTRRLEFIDDIINGAQTEVLQESALRLNWNFSKGYSVGVVDIDFLEDAGLAQQSALSYDRQSELANRKIRECMRTQGIAGITECRRHRAILLLEQPSKSEETAGRRIVAFYDALLHELCQAPAIQNAKAGFSSRCVDLNHIANSYKNAMSALKSCSILHQGGHALDYESLGLSRLLSIAQTRDDLKEFIPAKILLLLEHDQSKSANLLQTLESFFVCGRNIKKAAEQLYIHHKTMAYRLKRMEEIAALDLTDADQLLELEFGLKLYRIYQDAV